MANNIVSRLILPEKPSPCFNPNPSKYTTTIAGIIKSPIVCTVWKYLRNETFSGEIIDIEDNTVVRDIPNIGIAMNAAIKTNANRQIIITQIVNTSFNPLGVFERKL
jgi:hypothetical protein